MSLVESRSHIIHAMIPSEKMTAKNDLQTEYIYNSVGMIEALVLHRNSTVTRRVTNVTSEHYGDP